MVRSVNERSELQITTHIPRLPESLPPHIEQGIYRISQEALENVIKHSDATETTLSITIDSQTLILEIRDNGTGFRLNNHELNDHMGLTGMYERAAVLGGLLDVSSEPEQGTRIRLEIPDYDH